MSDEVQYDLRDGVATITLNRPQALNAWTAPFGDALLAALRDAADDPAVRAVVITGAGRAFSAGADLVAQRGLGADGVPDLSSALREHYNPVILAIRDLPKPVVAAVNGPAAGIGCSLALACDLVLAAESAYFLLAFVRVALSPDGGSTVFLQERIGPARAAELMMLGERLPARTAVEWGLANAVYADDTFAADVQAYADRLAAGPTVAIASAKRLLRQAEGRTLADQLEAEAAQQQTHATTYDFAEGVLAFRDKRPARFEGR